MIILNTEVELLKALICVKYPADHAIYLFCMDELFCNFGIQYQLDC